MNYNETLSLLNKIINNELNHVEEENLEGMDELEEYNKIVEENGERYEALLKALPSHLHKVLNDFYDESTRRMLMENRHYFKKGVAAGTTNLNFIRDITGGMKFY